MVVGAKADSAAEPAADRAARDSRAALIALLLLAVAFAALLALALQGDFPTYTDDAYIYLRFSRHLAEGLGPVWNRGEAPVMGFTSPLFQALAAGTEALGWSSLYRVGWLGVLAATLTLFVCWRLARRLLPGRPWAALLAPLLLAVQPEFHFWATAGMEMPLYTLLLAAAALAYVAHTQHGRAAWVVGVLLALTALARPEGVLVWLVVMGFELGRALLARRRPAPGFYHIGAAFLLLYVPYFLWQWATFGYPFPNTYYAKTGGGMMQVAGGLAYVRKALTELFAIGANGWDGLPLLLAALVGATLVAGWFTLRQHRTQYAFLSLLLLALLASTALAGGDHFPLARFLMPALPIAAVLLSVAAVAIWQRPQSYLPKALAALVVLALALGWAGRTAEKARADWRDWRDPAQWALPAADPTTMQFLDLWGDGFNTMGLTLGQIAGDDQSIAAVPIGAIGYFSGLTVLDMVGIVNSHIAHQPLDPAYAASWRPGHDKGDGAYILSQSPDFIQLVDRLTSQPHPGPDDHALQYKSVAEIWNSPAFHEQYVFFPIQVGNGWYYNLYRRVDVEP